MSPAIAHLMASESVRPIPSPATPEGPRPRRSSVFLSESCRRDCTCPPFNDVPLVSCQRSFAGTALGLTQAMAKSLVDKILGYGWVGGWVGLRDVPK